MAVSYRPSIAPANFADNICRWDRSAGHYEVWFLTLNHRASQRGFWFRYTIEAPSAIGHQGPRFGSWAGYFDRTRPADNFVIKSESGSDCAALRQGDGVVIGEGDNVLSASNATGVVEAAGHQVEWDLSFVPNPTTYHHISTAIERLVKPSSFVLSPNLNTRFTGRIVVDGRETKIYDEPGCQSHLWGRKHVDEWMWVHSNAFEKHQGTVFEGLAGRPRRAGRALPLICSLLLRHRGEEHRFVRLRFAQQWERRLGMGIWSFTVSNSQLRLDGTAQCRLRDMLQVEYRDPDGEPLYCINSEVANLKIRLFRRAHAVRWRHIETINAIGSAHLEHAARKLHPNVRPA